VILKYEILDKINDIKWNYSGDLFFIATLYGFIQLLDYPHLTVQHQLTAHTSACNCISMDPRGRYFATGGGDAILWDLNEFIPLQTFSRLEYL
jgi:THO complex subunit 3